MYDQEKTRLCQISQCRSINLLASVILVLCLLYGITRARALCSLENGLHRHVPEPVTMALQAGERLCSGNGVGAAVAMATTTTATAGAKATKQRHRQTETNKQDTGGGVKRAARGPGVLMEGSRCSRKNGRGWRCSQPTLVGYALCQYHLGKGRTKSGSAVDGGGRGRGPGQLGRTERANKTSAAADVPPAQSVQHC
jgi:hypothetical protein